MVTAEWLSGYLLAGVADCSSWGVSLPSWASSAQSPPADGVVDRTTWGGISFAFSEGFISNSMFNQPTHKKNKCWFSNKQHNTTAHYKIVGKLITSTATRKVNTTLCHWLLKGHSGAELHIYFLVHLESMYYQIFFYNKIVPNCAVAKQLFEPEMYRWLVRSWNFQFINEFFPAVYLW